MPNAKTKINRRTSSPKPVEVSTVDSDAQAGPGDPQAENSAMPAKAEPQTLDLGPEWINNPDRMQYALLLALLMKKGGSARFSAADLNHVDTDFNVVFSRSLNGQFLEVTVVSNQSGMIRSPESPVEVELWKRKLLAESQAYRPMPTYEPNSLAGTETRMQDLIASTGSVLQMPSNEPAMIFQPSPDLKIIPPANPDKPSPYQFPFETGNSPASARPVDLDQSMARLLQKDREIAENEAEAIQRQETGQ